jgi:16S rRNA (cytidine1402-2'-O)-methyltransferase
MLVRYAQEHGIEYEVLPGANAALTAWVASGYEGVFSFFGFLPHKKGRKEELQKVLTHPYHSILYEAPHRLLKLLEEVVSYDEERELFLAKELTKKHERFYKGRAKELLEKLSAEQIRGEWVVIVTPKVTKASSIDLAYIYELDIPKKEKAKLIAKITGEPIKVIYEKLINN